MPVIITVQGTAAARRKVRNVSKFLDQNHLQEIAEYTRSVAYSLAPKDTGGGARGIHIETHSNAVEVRSNDIHMYVMEYGRTRGVRMPSTDHVRGWAARHGWAQSKVWLLASTIGRRGIRPRRFMQKAAEAARTRLSNHAKVLAVKVQKIWDAS